MLPLPVNVVLVSLSPGIRVIRRLVEIPSWSSSYDAFLLVAAWWAVALLAEPALRFFLPVLVASGISLWAWGRTGATSIARASERTIQAVVTDLTAIESLLPAVPVLSPRLRNPKVLFHAALIFYVPYLVLIYLFRLRVLVALCGTIILTWRAPWVSALRKLLWKSAWFRWTVYYATAKVTGEPLPFAYQSSAKSVASASVSSAKSLRFLFTVYENQRWWMGLDWTAALLPGERPSWCTHSQAPVSPPSAFLLPDNTTIVLPHPDGKGRIKRCARWSWEEDEWRVLIRREGASGPSRVEKPLPSEKEENAGLLAKAAAKMREPSTHPPPSEDHSHSETDKTSASEEEEEELTTDEDGWVYEDNKWEKPSAKGGMGKYTRFRRWTRVAVVTETVEPAAENEEDVLPKPPLHDPVPMPRSESPESEKSRDGSPLRQRLKNVMHKAAPSTL
ncbi:unnamed protein product [Mycena citricolor]|uniref:Peroxin/Ferlin domain-containing protein n=1 Tax=Mycena citricolor TaxID=2018698 RepID=A0AAD2H6N3_9AGAR|nr:unnamed protein product [Mycena citricolor]